MILFLFCSLKYPPGVYRAESTWRARSWWFISTVRWELVFTEGTVSRDTKSKTTGEESNCSFKGKKKNETGKLFLRLLFIQNSKGSGKMVESFAMC